MLHNFIFTITEWQNENAYIWQNNTVLLSIFQKLPPPPSAVGAPPPPFNFYHLHHQHAPPLPHPQGQALYLPVPLSTSSHHHHHHSNSQSLVQMPQITKIPLPKCFRRGQTSAMTTTTFTPSPICSKPISSISSKPNHNNMKKNLPPPSCRTEKKSFWIHHEIYDDVNYYDSRGQEKKEKEQ